MYKKNNNFLKIESFLEKLMLLFIADQSIFHKEGQTYCRLIHSVTKDERTQL